MQIFGKKAVDLGARDAAYVMIAAGQTKLDDARLSAWADGFGLGLTLFYDLASFVDQALYWSMQPKRDAAKEAADRIRVRLIAVEAQPSSVQRWLELVAA